MKSDIMFLAMTSEALSAAISGVLVAVVFTLIAFLATKRSKKVDAVFQALWKRSWFEMTRKVVWGVFLILFAAGLLLTFYNAINQL